MRGHDRDELSRAAQELLVLERSRRETNAAKRARAFARVTTAVAGGAVVGLAAVAANAAASGVKTAGAGAGASAAGAGGASVAAGAGGAGVATGAGGAGVATGAGGAGVAAGTGGAAAGVGAKLLAFGSTKIAAVVIAAGVASGVGATVVVERTHEPPPTSAPLTVATSAPRAMPVLTPLVIPASAMPASTPGIEPPLEPTPIEPMPARAVAPSRPREPVVQKAITSPAAMSTASTVEPNGHPTTHPLEAERRLIDAARAALVRGDAASALASADEHEHLFPGGQLVAEREALAVRALVRSGHGDEARARARRFTQEHPNHALGEIVERAARDAR